MLSSTPFSEVKNPQLSQGVVVLPPEGVKRRLTANLAKTYLYNDSEAKNGFTQQKELLKIANNRTGVLRFTLAPGPDPLVTVRTPIFPKNF